VHADEDMPLVRIDFGLMEQVLYNLLFNAVQYAPTSESIEINAYHDKNYLVIEVMDRGPGFSAKDLPHIFDKFYRVEGTKTGGTGLGLSIAKGFTEAHYGKIKAENRKDGGAKFIIRIPTASPQFEINQ
jgi:two-component system sensor histidine kinase KdpD